MTVNAKLIVSIVISVMVVALVLIPTLNENSQELVHYTNPNGKGAELSMYDSGSDVEYSVSISKYDNVYTASGDYIKTLGASDMALMIADNQSLFIKDGSLYYFDGSTTSEVSQYTLTLNSTSLNGQSYEWVYFPTTNGDYLSYPDGFQYNISESVVGVGSFAGVTLVSKDTTITSDNPYGLTATIQTDGDATLGVIYGVE